VTTEHLRYVAILPVQSGPVLWCIMYCLDELDLSIAHSIVGRKGVSTCAGLARFSCLSVALDTTCVEYRWIAMECSHRSVRNWVNSAYPDRCLLYFASVEWRTGASYKGDRLYY
jgi:hypothetical protein